MDKTIVHNRKNIKLYNRFVIAGNRKDAGISVKGLHEAEVFWTKEAHSQIVDKLEECKFVKFNPVVNEKGIIVVGDAHGAE